MAGDLGAGNEADRFVAACRKVIRREMPGRFDELFSKLDDALYNLTDKSENDSLYSTYFDAMRVFRRRRHEILSLFLRELEEAELLPAPKPNPDLRPADSEEGARELELMEEAELEESLAVGNLISKAENRYRKDLAALRHYLASLRGQGSIDSLVDPLGPHLICNSFRKALSLVEEVELAIKLVVYKLFDKQVIDQLGGVYARCRDIAESQSGTLAAGSQRPVPRAPQEREQEREGRTPAKGAAFASSETSVPAEADIEQDAQICFSDLQRLLGRMRPAGAACEDRVVVDTGELMSVLSRLQESSGSEISIGHLRLRLRDELRLDGEDARGRALGRVDEDTLDLVFLLFEHILQGNDIPDALRSMIARLQIPFLKVALLDKSVFEDKHHPARCLLNHLAEVAVGWKDESDRSPGGVYERVEWVVDQVIARFDGTSAVLLELDGELCALLAREREKAHSQEVRVQQELELREEQHDARRLVRDAIDDRLGMNEPVPEAISSLLYEGWQQVLLAAYLRDGTAGADWREAMRTIDRLVWSVQPKVEYKDRRELLRSIPGLLRTLRESLAQVSYDQRRLARWFKELQALHIAALRGGGPWAAQGGSRTHPPDVSDTDSLLSGTLGDASTDVAGFGAAGSEVTGLQPGTWIEVRRDDGRLLRVKLAWRSPQSGINAFVDRRGRKSLELSGKDIVTLHQQGTLTVLEEVPIVDRAMYEVVRSLKGGSET